MSKVSGLLHAVQLYRSGNDWHRCSAACVCHYVHTRSSHSDNGASGGLYPENKIVLHSEAAVSYVLRNPSSHEVCVNPYDYPFSSIMLYFKSLIVSPGQQKSMQEIKGKRGVRPRLISVTNSLPEWVDVDSDGQVIPDQIVCSDLVEGYFGSYNAFNFGLNRRDYEQWNTQQMNDEQPSDPITLASIEPYLSVEEVGRILKLNPGWIKEKRVKDIDLCHIVDNEYVQRYHKKSYACLSTSEKLEISRKLLKDRNVTVHQVERCLGVTL